MTDDITDRLNTVTRVLMNRETPVLRFVYDVGRHAILGIADVYNAQAAPLYATRQTGQGQPALDSLALHNWWRQRALPLSRENIQRALRKAGIEDVYDLMDASHGLGLSDQYWVDDGSGLEWAHQLLRERF
jgi:hypothetical protein